MNRKYRHLSREERYEIKRMHDLGVSINKIAQELTRSKSTISMELKRNKVKGKYMPCVAQEKYKKRMCQKELMKNSAASDRVSKQSKLPCFIFNFIHCV